MPRYFVSAILPGEKQLGVMQFEAKDEEELKATSERLCPSRAAFRSYQIEEFETELPVDEFVTSETLTKLGY